MPVFAIMSLSEASEPECAFLKLGTEIKLQTWDFECEPSNALEFLCYIQNFVEDYLKSLGIPKSKITTDSVSVLSEDIEFKFFELSEKQNTELKSFLARLENTLRVENMLYSTFQKVVESKSTTTPFEALSIAFDISESILRQDLPKSKKSAVHL